MKTDRKRPWDGIISEDEQRAYRAAGFGRPGGVAWGAVRNIQLLLAGFRRRGWPVLYPHVAPKQATDGGRLAAKVPSIMTIGERGYDFVAEIAPEPGDVLIPKKHPSAF